MIQEYGGKIIHQDLLQHKDLRRLIIPQRYENSMNLNQEFEYVSSQILSDVKLENERLILRSELFFEYTKLIQDSLSWLTKLLDIKWRQLHNDFDNSLRWRLLNLQKQAEFYLKNLIKENQYTEKSKYSEDNFLRDENRNDISNDKKINVKKTTTLNGEDIRKLDKIEMNNNKTQKTDKNITDDKLALKVETRIMSHPQLLKNISNSDFLNKNYSSQNVLINKFQTDLNNRKNSETNLFIQDKFFTTTLKNHGNQFSNIKKRRLILPNKNTTNTLKEIDKQKHNKTRIIFRKFSRKDVIDKPGTSRRTLQILVPSDDKKDKKQKIYHVLENKTESSSREEIKARIDSISAMDEILEAVDDVLPTENPMEILSKGLKKTVS